MEKVKVISGKYAGKIYNGHRYYYDYLHTGNSPDLFMIETNEGNVSITSENIDVADYESQLSENGIARLGAKVGDMVIITRTGSGVYDKGWESTGIHEITDIDSCGYVQFDNGRARIFRPDVKKVD